jgi:hypothetical protein
MGHAFNASNDEKHNEHRAKQISRAQRREKGEEAHTRRLQSVSAALETGADDRASSWRTFQKRASSSVVDTDERRGASSATTTTTTDTGARLSGMGGEVESSTATMTKEGPAVTSSSSIAPPLLANKAAGSLACLLCRRMFPTLAALEKHRASSALHKSNLVLLEQEERRERDQNEPAKEDSFT